MSIIEVNKLTKFYGKARGIENVSFDVKEGEIFSSGQLGEIDQFATGHLGDGEDQGVPQGARGTGHGDLLLRVGCCLCHSGGLAVHIVDAGPENHLVLRKKYSGSLKISVTAPVRGGARRFLGHQATHEKGMSL